MFILIHEINKTVLRKITFYTKKINNDIMYQLRSVFFLAMDVVKGPYIHCYAPNQTQEVGPKRVCTNTQLGQ